MRWTLGHNLGKTDRHTDRQTEIGTIVPSHVLRTRQIRPPGLPGVVSWGWAMLGRPGAAGQCRVRVAESDRIESKLQAACSRTELNRKLCRRVGLVVWDDSHGEVNWIEGRL